MKFYIASGFRNIGQVRELANYLKISGCTQTYDWTDKKAESIADLAMIGEKERQAIIDSDKVIVILPAGKGSHVELGMAIALNKKVYLYAKNEDVFAFEHTSTFYLIEGLSKYIGSLELFSHYLLQTE